MVVPALALPTLVERHWYENHATGRISTDTGEFGIEVFGERMRKERRGLLIPVVFQCTYRILGGFFVVGEESDDRVPAEVVGTWRDYEIFRTSVSEAFGAHAWWGHQISEYDDTAMHNIQYVPHETVVYRMSRAHVCTPRQYAGDILIPIMAFSLSGLFKGFSLGGGDASIIGVDIGSSSAKIVQLRASRGVAILETYGEIALGPYAGQPVGKTVKLAPEKLAEALSDLMREANVTSRTGGISIPFTSSLVSVIDLPDVDDEALKRIIPIEARKYIPIPASEVTLDWFPIPREQGEDSALTSIDTKTVPQKSGREVLLVAIHNTLLQQYQTMTVDSGITPTFYEIEIFSAARATLGHGLAPVVLVDIGASTTKLYVVERGIVRLTHLFSQGGQQTTEILARAMNWEFDKAERIKRERGLIDTTAYSVDENERIKTALLSTLSRVFSEVNRVVLNYGQRYNKNVARVVLSGGGASLPGIANAARQALNVEVEIANPFGHTEAPAFLENVLRDIGPGFTVAVGVALRNLKHS